MGSFLSFVASQGELKTSCQLINFSLAKIRELHGSFKSICDNFAVNLTEFETIFSSNEATFAIWDTDNNGLVDAMEVFAGLIMFADSKAEDKIRFLFDLFDFNEIQTISLMDLEFAIQCIVISTSKIFQIGIDVDELEITRLVRSSFAEGIRITLPQLLKWASLTDEPKLFFSVFRMVGPEMISVKTLQENEFIVYEKHLEKQGKTDLDALFPSEVVGYVSKGASQLTQNRRALNFRSWLYLAMQPIIAYRLESKTLTNYLRTPDELKTKLEWVYGIRTLDCKRPIQYLVGRMQAQSTGQIDKYEKMQKLVNEELIYFIANVVVLLNANIYKQRFYVQHEQEVISCAISNVDGGLVATGELGKEPAIHIWNSRTLECHKVLKGIHQTGVHLLAFSNDDTMVISCSLETPSSVLIYSWQSGEAMISTSIDSPTQEIFCLPRIQVTHKPVVAAGMFGVEDRRMESVDAIGGPTRDGFAVVSLSSVIVFTLRETTFTQSQVPLNQASDDTIEPPICAITLIADQRNNFFALMGIELEGRRHLFLTGHKDGKVLIWRSDSYIGMLADYRDEITAMSPCFEGIAIGTARGFIHIWDNYLSRSIKTIELHSLPFKLLSFAIINIDYNQRRLLVVTAAGDAVEIQLDQSHTNKVKAKRINAVTKVHRNQRAATILNQIEKTIMVAGDDGVVLSFDMATHELIDVWQVGAKVTALSSLSLQEGGFIVAAGTIDGNLIIRQDWEEIVPRHHQCGNKQINDCAFSKNGALVAVASQDKHIYLFQYQDGDYQKLTANRLENGHPVSVNFSEDSKKIVICTNQRKLLLLDPQTSQLMFRVEDLAQYFWSNLIGRYPLVTKSVTTNLLPFALGHVTNNVVAADENGNLHIWKDVESIKENVGINLMGHASAIYSVQFTKDDKRIVSFGAQDQCIMQWRLNTIEESETKPESKSLINKIVLDDDALINELNFCYSAVQHETATSEDQGILIRGGNNLTTNRVLAQLNFEFQEPAWKRPPALSLVLDHIYGVQTSERRNTVFYMHFSSDVEPTRGPMHNASITQMLGLSGAQNARLDQILPKMLGPNYQMLLQGTSSIKYDTVHQACQKFICYYTSRYAIMFTPPQEQKFYEGHSVKISCITRHPHRRLIATGEVNVSPTIHIWDAQTFETVRVLETAHKGGVLHLTFSKDGHKLVSIGMDRTFSIQIFNWEQNRTIAFRNLGYLPVFAIKFDPYDNNRFITSGYEHMACWKITGSHLTCINFQQFKSSKQQKPNPSDPAILQRQAPTVRSSLISVDFLSYKLGHSIQSDALFGTSQGEILTFCSGRLLMLNETAHDSAINCLMIVDQLTQSNSNVVTGGEDGLLKIWDSAVNLLQVIDTRSAQILKDLKDQRAYAIQSLDFYCCDKKNPRRMLIGQRCGEILEAVITEQPGAPEEVMLAVKINKGVGEGLTAAQKHIHLKFDFFTYISGHSSLQPSSNQKKIFMAVYPLHPLIATAGDDCTLRFWDINKKSMILSKNLGTQASSMVFSPDGSYLVIGLVNGVMLVLESKIEKLNYGTYMEEYTLPSLEVLISNKEAKAGIVCMKFSYKGDFLAVSFNNEYTEEQLMEELARNKAGADASDQKPTQIIHHIGTREPSFILLYVNRHSMKNPGLGLNKKDPYIKLNKIILPLADFQPSAYIRSILAVTHMDFSEEDDYIQFCVQRVNAEGVKYLNKVQPSDDGSKVKDIVIVWNIKRNEVVIDFDEIKNCTWPEWSMGPSINARKKGSEVFLDDITEERKLLFNELVYMSAVQRFGLLDNAICGSQDGSLVVFRFLALTIEKLRVKDFNFELVRKREMAATRNYQAHTSMINNVEISQDKVVLSTSIQDQCIIQWRVEYEDQHWELDFNQTINDVLDPFGEVPNLKKFEKLISENWYQRLQITEIQQGVSREQYADPACDLQLEHVIGRRAYDRRNNLKVDCMDRLCYQASSIQVFMLEKEEDGAIRQSGDSKIMQTFLRPDKNKFNSISPELSHFCLSQDLRTIFIASSQVVSSIFVWELTTNCFQCKLDLPNCPVVLNIKVAHDSNHLLVLGLTKDYNQCLLLLNWKTQKMLAVHVFLHSLPFKIKDIDFIPGSTRRFITAGIQHMNFWKLSGSNLTYQVGELTIAKAYRNVGGGTAVKNIMNQAKFGISLVTDEYHQQLYMKPADDNTDLDNLYVTFLCICFLPETLITSGDDGFLYIWDGERIVRKVQAAESSIFALNSNPKLGLLISGGLDGTVTLWRFLVETKSNVKSLERLKLYSLRKNLDVAQAISSPECNIQSLCIGYNRIIVGMRSGSIYEMKISEESMKQGQPQNKIKQWLKCTDHELPKCVGIDMISSRIYTLTALGLFSVWDIYSFDIVFQKHFHKQTRSLQALKLSNNVLIVFEHEIKMLDANPKMNTFLEMTEYSMNLNTITFATMNQNEKLLGVATTSAARPEITLYSTANGFMKLTQIFGFKSTIRYLDFSTDNYYLQIEDNIGEIILYEIETERPIQSDAINFEIEWLGEGLRTQQQIKGIHHQYGQNNKIVKIKKVLGKPIILIGDQIGTIRLFNYPNVTGEPHYQCYSEHLFQISDCQFSPDTSFFVSSCEMDRCVFKWSVKYNVKSI